MAGTRTLLNSINNRSGQFRLREAEQLRLRQLLLDMCAEIFQFCEEHQLTCMLGGGSVLGAVRHGGFIPWDDDLDLNMPRADYEAFIRLFSEEKKERYELFVPDGSHSATNLFLKVSLKNTILEDIYTMGLPVSMGVSIDIFPIEDAPARVSHQILRGLFSDLFAYAAVSAFLYQNRNEWMRQLYSGSRKAAFQYSLRCMLGWLLSFREYSFWYRKFDRFSRHAFSSDFCTVPTGRGHYRGELRKKSALYPPQKATFETLVVYLPKDTDAYLSSLYGDYRTLPPEEKRERHFYTNVELEGDAEY